MNIEKTNLEGVLIVTPDVYTDERGMFMETFSEARYQEMLGLAPDEHFVQDNLSVSKKGVLRGLHYQAPSLAQGKLVMVTRGRVLDVAVDIRAGVAHVWRARGSGTLRGQSPPAMDTTRLCPWIYCARG
jgi:dTDP-4-dehydrorhamnose 3,5-epimerase